MSARARNSPPFRYQVEHHLFPDMPSTRYHGRSQAPRGETVREAGELALPASAGTA
jgi:hypothetical protein